jgi:hypothetical protein
MNEYLTFRRMITPVIIQAIFWIAVAVLVIGGIVKIADGSVGQGLFLVIVAPLLARIYAEILLVVFKINENVAAIRGGKVGEAAPG